MARKEIKIDTNHGDAVAVPQEDSPWDDEWVILTPWGEQPFCGTKAAVRWEMKEIIRRNHAAEAISEKT